MNRAQLNEWDLQQVQRLGERGVRRAGEALATLLGHPVRIDVASAQMLAPRAVAELAAGAGGSQTAGVACQITGEMDGEILLLFPLASVFQMLHVLLGVPMKPRPLSEEEESAVQVVGNILASSFLSELGDGVKRRLMHSIPRLQLGGVPELTGSMRQGVMDDGMEVLLVQARLTAPECAVEAGLFVLPEVRSLKAVLEGPGAAEEVMA